MNILLDLSKVYRVPTNRELNDMYDIESIWNWENPVYIARAIRKRTQSPS